ncbi:MAG: hypothetical protein WCI86_02880 [Actinomycetota bacterium]
MTNYTCPKCNGTDYFMRPGKADALVPNLGMPMEIAICRTCDEKMTPSAEIAKEQKKEVTKYASKMGIQVGLVVFGVLLLMALLGI